MKLRFSGVAAALTVAALATAVQAPGATVSVEPVDELDLETVASEGAIGLAIPAWGDTVSRETALAALERGRLTHPLREDSSPSAIDVNGSGEPADVRILVVLPPDEVGENDRRYPVAVIGGGYRGLLTSRTTRIRGLVAISDIAPTVLDLEGAAIPDTVTGHVLRFASSNDPVAELEDLDSRLASVRGSRFEAGLAYASLVAFLALVAVATRAPVAGRAALLALPAAACSSVGLAIVGVSAWWAFATVTAALAVAAARVLRTRTALGLGLVAAIGFHYAALLWAGEAVSLSLLGPNPDTGGRFYGLPNELETILAGTAIVAAALLWDRFGLGALVAVGGLALVTISPGQLGASVTGAIVVFVGISFLAIRLEGRRGLVAVGLVAGAAAAALLVASPDHLSGAGLGRWIDRVELSARLTIDSGEAIVLFFAVGLGGLLLVLGSWLVLKGELDDAEEAAFPALLLAILVSIVVNDSPSAVAAHGSLLAFSLTAFAVAGSRAGRPERSYTLVPVCAGRFSSRSRRSQ